MIESIISHNQKLPEISVEGHPNSTTIDQLKVLYSLGARRLSLGIQDFNEKVQKQINRIQTFEQVEKVCLEARDLGYHSINFDLIYGLPHQTINTVADTIEKTLSLKPDRIAFYSYAHVPWIKKAQKSYEEFLPAPEEKRALYELGKEKLQASGYKEIGMDHFALESDGLYQALLSGDLHRNFMGYTTQATKYVIGLGVSSISDIWTGFSQNHKTIKEYQDALDKNEFPAFRGHILNNEDLSVRQHILDLMCQFVTSFDDTYVDLMDVKARLSELESDQLIEWDGNRLFVTETGRPFIRNICMSLDMRMIRKKPESQLFSQTI
jgi:oxygen-independent coproporphyrinogen-3 oxidase